MIYAFIQAHPEHPVVRWAKFFEVSTSGYYAWLEKRYDRQAREDKVAERVETVFDRSGGTYGADRIAAELRKLGFQASFRKVKRIMNERGLYSVHLRYRRSLTDSRGAKEEDCKNLLRDLDILEPFQALSSDITYIPTAEGFEYCCTIRDIRSGVILAKRMASRMTKKLVMETIRSASRSWRLSRGTVFHSDLGSQYTSTAVREQLRSLGLRQSFSRKGKPGDNSWSESFFSVLKREVVHPIGRFESREEARQMVFAYIHGFYNTRRIQKQLGYLSPLDWLKRRSPSTLNLTA